MTAVLTLSAPFERQMMRPGTPVGCPLPAACEYPEYPSGVVLMFQRRTA